MIILLTATTDWVYPHFTTDFQRHNFEYTEVNSIKELLKIQDKKYECIFYPDKVSDDTLYVRRVQELVRQKVIYLPVVLFSVNASERPHVWEQSKTCICWYIEKDVAKDFKREGNFDNCIYLNLGASPVLFYKKEIGKDIDVSFVSRIAHTGDKKAYLKWLEGRIHVTGNVSFEELNDIYNHSKINLGIAHESGRMIPKARNFEITMSGNFLLTQYCDELEDSFVIGKEIETWKTKEELMEKTDYYLRHENERKRIALAGYERTRNNYTWTQRMNTILEFVRNK